MSCEPCLVGGQPITEPIHGPESMCPGCGAIFDLPAPWTGETWPEHHKRVHMGMRPDQIPALVRAPSTPVEKEDDFLAAAVATYTVINL